jgi:hypothetical protein
MTTRVYQPRQRTDGRWEYSVSGDVQAHVVGYCAGWHYDDGFPTGDEAIDEQWAKARGAAAPFRLNYHTEGHGTEEEARRCFNLFLIDRCLLTWEVKTQEPCVSCGVPTEGRITIALLYKWAACSHHDARVVAAHLLQGEGGIRTELEYEEHAPASHPHPPQKKNVRPKKQPIPQEANRESEASGVVAGPLDSAKGRG